MEDLLPHYERELAFLRGHSGEFARRYPKIAGRLLLSGDVGEDPHVERLIESFALLSSRIHKRLDDDFPLFTESFFEVLYPHYLRPFPSCTIASFDVSQAAAQMSGLSVMPRGTYLQSRPVHGVTCKFRTAYDLALAPIGVAEVLFRGAVSVPDGTPLPKGVTSMLSVRLELTSVQVTWESLGLSQLRVHLDGEASQVTALREALFGKVRALLVQSQAHGAWQTAPGLVPQAVGFADDEALLDTDARTQPAYRYLTEYFAFPEKFNFADLPLPVEHIQPGSRFVTLHFLMSGIRSDSNEAALLETVSQRNLLLHCTPLVNLFEQRADPIRVTHQTESYTVLPDGRKAFGFEVYAIERVFRLKQTPRGEIVDEFSPFYSLQHSELLDEGDDSPRYWSLHRDETLSELSPGYETEISIVDVNFNPARPQTDTLSIDLKATNRNLPSLLSIANQGGDLFASAGSQAGAIRMLRKPTPAMRFERAKGALWRLISHLSLNHLSLSEGGLDAIKEMLRLYDLPRSATNRSSLDGLVAIDYKAATAYLPGNPFATFVRGMEISLTVDEQKFTGTGLRLFSQVLDHFFGLYVHVNSFTQLKIFSSRTQEELIACPRRSGNGPLL